MKHAREDYNRIQDPLELIGKDEPVFLLRAKDKSAPGVVRFWANNQIYLNNPDKAIIQMAFDQAKTMQQWQEKNGSKLPDGPKEGWNELRGCFSSNLEEQPKEGLPKVVKQMLNHSTYGNFPTIKKSELLHLIEVNAKDIEISIEFQYLENRKHGKLNYKELIEIQKFGIDGFHSLLSKVLPMLLTENENIQVIDDLLVEQPILQNFENLSAGKYPNQQSIEWIDPTKFVENNKPTGLEVPDNFDFKEVEQSEFLKIFPECMKKGIESQMKESKFRRGLEDLINGMSMENGSDTPDWILAEFLDEQLKLWDRMTNKRDKFFDRKDDKDSGESKGV